MISFGACVEATGKRSTRVNSLTRGLTTRPGISLSGSDSGD
jgi:hypothetical protein